MSINGIEIAGQWLRVSSAGQDETNQEPDVARWIRDHGYELGETYRLRGKSAFKGNPKFDRMWTQVLDDFRAGRIHVLVVWALDRIDRKLEAFKRLEEVVDAGGRVEFVTQPHLNDLTTMGGRIALKVQEEIAHAESTGKSERVLAAHNAIKSNGGVIGRPGYGYEVVGEAKHKTLAIHPEEATVVREAVDRYLAGESVEDIVNDFNRRGISKRTKRDGTPIQWHVKTLAQLLRSPSIAGRRVDADGKTVHTYDPIITWDEHKRIVARMDKRANRQGISPGNTTALLTGMLFDADGNPMYRIHGWGKPKYYSRQSKASVDLAWLDEQIESMFAGNSVLHMVRQLVPGDNNGDEIARLRQDRSELDDMAEDYDERHAKLTKRIRELVTEDEENPNPDRIEMTPDGRTLGEVWREMNTADRRDLLLAHDVRVTWRGDGWSFESQGLGLGDGALTWGGQQHGSNLRERALRAYKTPSDGQGQVPRGRRLVLRLRPFCCEGSCERSSARLSPSAAYRAE
jgi:DNA invertase Pin-like site-specific DNA recombinase